MAIGKTYPAEGARSASASSQTIPAALESLCARRLHALCRAAGLTDESPRIVETFRSLVSGMDAAELARAPGWLSEISDDNTPVELSAAIAGGRVQVRALLEAQAAEPTMRAYREAALALTARLESDHGADLTRFRAVEDLFLPEDVRGAFALWHSVVFDRGAPPAFKAYFNPQARGPGRAQALVEEALARLGMGRAWGSVCSTATRGPHLDELKYFALDLSADATARVKVYVRHHHATPDDLEAACSVARDHVPGEVLEFVRAMIGDRPLLGARAPFTCSAFVGDDPRPAATTVYVPICAYARDDAEAQRRVHAYLESHGIDPAPYDSLLSGYAHRPLDAGVGLQSWVALRRFGTPRLTVYLATEARRVHPPGTVPAASEDRLTFASADAVMRCIRTHDLSRHPIAQRLRREGEAGALPALAAELDSLLAFGESDDPEEAKAQQWARTLSKRQLASLPGESDAAGLTAPPDVPLPALEKGVLGLHWLWWRALDALYADRFGGRGEEADRS